MNWLRACANALIATFRDGARLWRLAPLIPVIAFLPEMAQHVAEIKLGMFASADAFKALSNDPTRWAFGYAKIAGLFLCIFASARFWWLRGTGARWWDLRTVAWRPFLIGAAINVAAAALMMAAKSALTPTLFDAVNLAITIITLPVMVLMLGGLFGDREVTLRRCFGSGWIQAAAMAALFAAAMMPAQLVHRLDHTAAMGAGTATIWALMVWDAVLVSLMAAWAGTGLAAGYAIPTAARGGKTFIA